MLAAAETVDRWLTLREAAEYLAVSYSQVTKWHQDRFTTRFPSHGTHKSSRVKRSDLDRWYPSFLDK